MRMVRMEEDTSPSEEDEDGGSESEVNTDYGSLAEHLEADSEEEYIRLEGESTKGTERRELRSTGASRCI